ncbi:ATP-dependent zinc metalloprotease FTSH 6, chloroplastic-like [Panicum virgatum]|uniref:ATP-dependent zinc metalloprotease FTSH 6, chloroplastic-like n=1 Tax=Panicum virgatum TaxID=38727 RepID=UPI0019D51B2D|nr:ATP-dependent zinc metalloprotease FTSH 6, chloroplastic-like [Panicum virgatum]
MSPTTAMSLTTTSRLPICRAHQDASSKQQGLSRRRVLQSAGLGLGLGLAAARPAGRVRAETAAAPAPAPEDATSNRMSYSRFLDYLDAGAVRKVDLFENGAVAVVELDDPALASRTRRVRVQLPGLPM